MRTLSSQERLRLVRFVCSFAWVDLEVTQEERGYVARLVERLELDEGERAQVAEWLKLPPPIDEMDPNDVPQAHRELFLDEIKGLIASDLDISPEEKETVEILDKLLVKR